MHRKTLDIILRLWVVFAVATGIGLIIFGATWMTTVGVLLIIFGLVGAMPAMLSLMGDWEADWIEKE